MVQPLPHRSVSISPYVASPFLLEKSLQEGPVWTVFEANDLPLSSKVRASVEAFLLVHFRQGAFRGTVPRYAFFVRCGNDATSADELRRGLLNLHVGFAAL